MKERLSAAQVHERFPELRDLPVKDCSYSITPAELEQALFIKLPPTPDLVLVYMDFPDNKALTTFVSMQDIKMHQQRLDKLSKLKGIAKYFILTPNKGAKPQPQ